MPASLASAGGRTDDVASVCFIYLSKTMTTNVGRFDQTIRITLGVVVILAGLITQSWWGLIGLIPLITGAVGSCPIYSVFGIRTCKIPGKPVA